MNLKDQLKNKVIKTAYALNLGRANFVRHNEPGCIVGLHRVLKSADLSVLGNDLIELSADFFEKFLLYLMTNKYRFLSIDQLTEQIKLKQTSGKLVNIGFDDGYLDNYTVAFPILKKYQIPFTIYATTDFIDHKAELWWYQLSDLLMQRQKLDWSYLGAKFGSLVKLETMEQKKYAFAVLRNYLLKSNFTKRSEFFTREWQKPYSEVCAVYCKKHCMGWTELTDLALSPLVTIGAHSLTHPALSQINEEEAKHEMIGSKNILENKLGQPIKHFAYPFGGKTEAGAREYRLAQNLGFSSAVTTKPGTLYRSGSQHLTSLPRILIGEDLGIEKFWLQASGFRESFKFSISQ